MERIRQIIFYKDYFLDFYDNLTDKVKDKIEHVLLVAERIPGKFLQHLSGTDGLYEVRVEYQGNIYRIFSCFDEGNLVVLFNAFQKKSQKTPPAEIEKALKIKAEYFIEKVKSKGYGKKK
ncbi:MAG: type II toxin-antitoxin system RelE/ParE family toxin [Cyclobacteriaceae bacterium]|jgi:phage-related protein|nr:type II toxin-antitoxin system RelE/ParE family toxin [Cyclobacteriaceae bacterium]